MKHTKYSTINACVALREINPITISSTPGKGTEKNARYSVVSANARVAVGCRMSVNRTGGVESCSDAPWEFESMWARAYAVAIKEALTTPAITNGRLKLVSGGSNTTTEAMQTPKRRIPKCPCPKRWLERELGLRVDEGCRVLKCLREVL